MEQRVILSGGVVVFPDTTLDAASVVVEHGHIVAIEPRAYPAGISADEQVIDVSGRVVMPGIVDLHNDALELEINPRPRSNFPLPLALDTADRRLAASGVTTELHAIFFANYDRKERRLEDAPQRVQEIRDYAACGDPLVTHDVLYRADLWNRDSIEHVIRAAEGAVCPVISLNDHTPGQGQYRDAEGLKLYLQKVVGQSAEEAERNIQREIDRAREQPNIAIDVLERVRLLRQERDLVLVSHDDDSAERAEQMFSAGARIGEFPINREAALRQRDLGMTIVMGAPNVVRGGSSSGNISALELLAEGLVDVLCADYFSPALLYAVAAVVEQNILDIASATRLVTLNPARAIHRGDEIGSIAPGKRADLVVVDLRGSVPRVEQVVMSGQVRFQALTARGIVQREESARPLSTSHSGVGAGC
ncbi:MAG: alpha-D-ribose 1-methylphosphonate 5-triphosphate diphosphatase [Chloroflexota bacterium]